MYTILKEKKSLKIRNFFLYYRSKDGISSSIVKLLLLIIISSACCRVTHVSDNQRDLSRLLQVNQEIRSDIESILTYGEAEMKKYPKIYNDTYNDMIQYAKDGWLLGLLMSEATDDMMRKEYNQMTSLVTNFQDIKSEYYEGVVRLIMNLYILQTILKIMINHQGSKISENYIFRRRERMLKYPENHCMESVYSKLKIVERKETNSWPITLSDLSRIIQTLLLKH